MHSGLRIAALLVMLIFSANSSADTNITGLWRQHDDETGKPRSLVRIEARNNGYEGHIERVFLEPGESAEPRCDDCPGDRRGKPLAGLVILTGLHGKGSDFDGGEILDPEDGKLYRCKATLSNDGKRLTVRGYLGVSLFGRSQIWQRED